MQHLLIVDVNIWDKENKFGSSHDTRIYFEGERVSFVKEKTCTPM